MLSSPRTEPINRGRNRMFLQSKGAALGKAAMLAASFAVCYAPLASSADKNAGAAAQAWPTKPIRMLVGFPAGGPTDVVARIVSERVGAQVGQRIVVDNRAGAAGNIAVEILAKSIPDGHTLLYS